MKKKAISIILVLCITLSLLPQSAFAAEPEESAVPPEVSAEMGEPTEPDDPPVEGPPEEAALLDAPEEGAQLYAERVAYPVEGGSIYFNPGSGAIVDCDTSATSVNIPAEINGVHVTSIGNDAFNICTNLTSVTIPDSVNSVGDRAFCYCSGLTNIVIPEGVISIGDYVFGYCRNLVSITIPNSVTNIGGGAFSNCNSLSGIILPYGITNIGNQTFSHCEELTSIVIPNSVTGIENEVFYGCSGLTNITIPGSVTSIGSGVFHDCTSLRCITIPESVTSIGESAFAGCSSLTSITLPCGVTSIENSLFSGCNVLASVTIPDSVFNIGKGAFCNCSALTSILIPASVTSIGERAFIYCNGLTNITIPDGVSSIEGETFAYCKELASITIPGSITRIEHSAFVKCSSLTSITIPSSVTSIGEYAFDGCNGLTGITISGGVISIKQKAFRNCRRLTNITIPSSINSIEQFAFDNCSGLVDVFYGGSEEDWGEINIGSYNSPLTDATIHYNSGGPGITFHRVYRTPPYPGDNGYEIFDVSLEECLAKKPSAEYNPQLAHMLIAMCGSVHEDANIRRTFDSFGFLPENYTTSYDTLSSEIMLAYGMARKQYTDENGNEKTLVLVVARGTDDWNEWASNILDSAPDSTGLHGGFSDAGSALRTKLREFLGTVDYSNMTFVITGFSRGAAAANILEQRLLDTGVREEQLYGYNFACPEVGLVSETEHSHRCMFNLSDAADAVSWVHGLGFGWGKYGRSFWFSNDWSDYQALKTSTSPHSEVKYLEFLRNEKPVEEYRQRGAADAALKEAGARRAAEESKKYFQGSYRGRIRRVSQHCPVNVEVYHADGQLAGSVIDGEVRIELPDDVYIYTLQDEKFIYLLREGNYDIRMTGTDTGAMSYVIEDIDMETWEALETKTFESVALTTGKEFASNINVQDTPDAGTKVKDVPLYVLGDSAEPGKAVLADGSGTEVPLLRLTADASGGLHGVISLLREDGSAGTEGLCGYVAAYDANGRFRGVEECRISSSGQSLTLELQGGLHTETGAGPVLKAFVVGPNMAPVCGTDTVQAIA